MLTISPQEQKELKGKGYILTRDGEHFIARIVHGDGVFSAPEMQTIIRAAEEFGNGSVALTSRMTLEVQGLSYEKLPLFAAAMKAAGLTVGGTGARVRPVACCKGTVCVHGLTDTQKLARELHERFFLGWHDVTLPHKFKIGVGGCPNNCVKPQLNDFGIVTRRYPRFDPALCRGCKKCSASLPCPIHCWQRGEDGKMYIRENSCSGCGKCVDQCVFRLVTEESYGYSVTVGGLWGKTQRMGTPVPGIFSHDELMELVEKCILLYRQLGFTGERLGRCIDRVGPEEFIRRLLGDEPLRSKAEILAAPLNIRT